MADEEPRPSRADRASDCAAVSNAREGNSRRWNVLERGVLPLEGDAKTIVIRGEENVFLGSLRCSLRPRDAARGKHLCKKGQVNEM